MKHIITILCMIGICCTGCGRVQEVPYRSPISDNQYSHIVERNSEMIHGVDKPYEPVTISSYDESGQLYDTTYTEVPQRVIAVWQNSIETIIALGEGHRIVAGMGIPHSKYVKPEYREAYHRIPYKSMEHLNLETVLMMKADLMVGWKSTFTRKVLQTTEFWRSRGVHTYIAASSIGDKKETKTIEAEYQYIRDLGQIFHKEAIAEQLIRNMDDMISHTVMYTKGQEAPKVAFIELGGKSLRLYGKDTLAGNIGMRLHADVVDVDSGFLSMEDLIAINPDVIFLIVSDGSYSEADAQMKYITQQPSLQRLKAIANGRVHVLPLLAVYSPGVRLADGITIISHGLYPHLYPEGVPDYLQ